MTEISATGKTPSAALTDADYRVTKMKFATAKGHSVFGRFPQKLCGVVALNVLSACSNLAQHLITTVSTGLNQSTR